MNALGVQILADMYDCDPAVLDDEDRIRASMLEAVRRCGATIVSQCFHRFSPQGVSGVVIIAESHLAIHTWPEHGYAAIDLFTCGERLRPEDCFSFLCEAFRSGHQTMNTIPRGRAPLGGAKDKTR